MDCTAVREGSSPPFFYEARAGFVSVDNITTSADAAHAASQSTGENDDLAGSTDTLLPAAQELAMFSNTRHDPSSYSAWQDIVTAVKESSARKSRRTLAPSDEDDNLNISMQDPNNLLSREEREARYSLRHPSIRNTHQVPEIVNSDNFKDRMADKLREYEEGDDFKDPADNTALPVNPDLPEIPRATSYNDTCFLTYFDSGDATLSYRGGDSLHGLNLDLIQRSCPLLAFSFEETSTSGMHFYADILDDSTCVPFVRFLYLGSYAWSNVYDDVPTSLLLHCRMYRLGDVFALPDLKSQAYVNVMRQCHYACSSPDKPIDLCSAIDFVYEELGDHKGLMEEILSFCVSCFLSHKLGEDEAFRELSYRVRSFHQDLCVTVKARDFEDDSASAIIQMPFEHFTPPTYLSREDISPDRVHDHVHSHQKTLEAARKGKAKAKATQQTERHGKSSGKVFSRYGIGAPMVKAETFFGISRPNATDPPSTPPRNLRELSEEESAGLNGAVYELATQQMIGTLEDEDNVWWNGENYIPIQQMKGTNLDDSVQGTPKAKVGATVPEEEVKLPSQGGRDFASIMQFRKKPVPPASSAGTSALSAAMASASDSESEFEKVEMPHTACKTTGHEGKAPDLFSDSEDDDLVTVSLVRQAPASDRVSASADSSSVSDWDLV
ncbi:hypothetical protein MBLNU230_g3376t1 [Neophaeotheca triangularis]